MADFDIVVPSEMRAASCDVLERSGYQRFWSEGEETRPFSHAATYVNEMGRQFDIHWQLLTGCTDSRPFWSAAVPIRVGSTPSLVPSPSDLFLHVCAHGLRRNQVAPLRWIVDAAVIIQSQDFDWDRLELLAGKYRYSVLISEAVRVLSELGVPIPAHVAAKWSVLRLSKLERAEFDRAGGIRKKSVASQLASSWLAFGRFSGDGTPLRNLSQFPRYLQASWSTSSIWTVPGIAVSKTIRRAIPKARAGINTKALSQSKSNDADVR